MNTLLKIWNSKGLIWEGFINKIFKRDKIELVYKKRLKHCLNCPSMDTFGEHCAMPGTNPCCAECGCSLSLKLRSLDSECPYPTGPKWSKEKI